MTQQLKLNKYFGYHGNLSGDTKCLLSSNQICLLFHSNICKPHCFQYYFIFGKMINNKNFQWKVLDSYIYTVGSKSIKLPRRFPLTAIGNKSCNIVLCLQYLVIFQIIQEMISLRFRAWNNYVSMGSGGWILLQILDPYVN